MSHEPMLPGESDLVVRAALFDLPRMEIVTAEDEATARLLTDVRKRYQAHQVALAQANHKRWIAALRRNSE